MLPGLSLTEAIANGSINLQDLLPPSLAQDHKKQDKIKLTALVVLVLAGLVTVFAGLCVAGIFPTALFGGLHNTLFLILGSGITATIAGGIYYYKWQLGPVRPLARMTEKA